MLKTFTEIVNIVGVAGVLVVLFYLLSILKKSLDDKASHTTGTEHQVYQTASNSVGLLQNIIKFSVARVDGDPTPSNEKKEEAIREAQKYADEHNINVPVNLLSGMVESAVNDLRAKQGLPLPSANTTVQPAQTPENNLADNNDQKQPVYVSDTNNLKQSEPINPDL